MIGQIVGFLAVLGVGSFATGPTGEEMFRAARAEAEAFRAAQAALPA